MFSRLNVRTKLLVMLLPAALGLCGLAGLGVKTRLDDRNAAQTTREASEVAATASAYVHRLQVERVAAATVAAAPSTELEATLVTERIATDEAGSRLDTVLDRSGETLGGDAAVAKDLGALRRGRGQLDATRTSGTTAAATTEAYSNLIDGHLAAVGRLELVADGAASTTASRRWLAAGIEAESRSAATAAGLFSADATPEGRAADAVAARELVERARMFYDTYEDYAGTEELGRFDAARSSVGSARTDDAFAELANPDAASTFGADADTWPASVRDRLDAVVGVERAGYNADIARFAAAAEAADSSVVYFAAGAVGTSILVLLLAFVISRHLTATLRRLTDAAREISQEQVPALVHSLKSGAGVQGLRFTEVETGSRDELAEVGSALNELGRAMVAVATEQQMSLRKGISDIFVNLARRNQTLLDRQIQFIDRLEANEEDPDQLENLFRLDHLATRMRRNAESLLVLAGAEAPRRRARDVGLSDVIRVAVGEVEDFARITLVAVEDAEAIGGAAVDIAHLLAELMENGAQYSPPEKTVDIIGHRAVDGGYVISISDYGVGMAPDRLEVANRLLASPPPVGLALSRSLGFVVAGTLANRHGITVHLAASASGGVTAEVTLPPSLVRAVEVPVAEVPVAEVSSAAATLPTRPVGATAGWTADGEYVDGFSPVEASFEPASFEPASFEPASFGAGFVPGPSGAASFGDPPVGEPVSTAPPPHDSEDSDGPDETPFTPWDPAEAITWSEERLPAAPAPSKLVDMLPEGHAFEQGLYSLLGENAPAADPGPEGPALPPPAVTFDPMAFDPPPPPPLPSLPSRGVPGGAATTPPTGPAATTPAGVSSPPGQPAIPQLWAAPIVHPRPAAAVVGEPAPAVPAPALPQRSPGGGGGRVDGGRAENGPMPADRSAAPQRAPEEVRSVLSRYRNGLSTGRSGGGDAPADPNLSAQHPADPTPSGQPPVYDPNPFTDGVDER